MKTLTANRSLSRQELVSILKNGLSDHYRYKIVDDNEERYVLVRKNALVGAKIFSIADKISIEAVVPTLGGYLFAFAVTFWTGLFLGVPQPWLNFEKTIGSALLKVMYS